MITTTQSPQLKSLQRYLENKESKIRKLKNLTDEQKTQLITLFNKYNYLESKIDWNDDDLTFEDFKDVIALAGKSKSSQKKHGIEGIIEGKDYKYFGEGSNPEIGKYKLYQPLTYEGSKVLASNRVEPKVGDGARWCISYQKSDQYWEDYTESGCKFLFALTEKTKYAITIYSHEHATRTGKTIEVFTADDANIGNPNWCEDDDFLEEVSRKIGRVTFKDPEFFLTKDSQGTYSLLKEKIDELEEEGYSLSSKDLQTWIDLHVKNGKFTVKFKEWQSDFICSRLGLTSLEGCPDIVNGDFDCRYNKLTSLKNSPKIVKGSFYCTSCALQSLEGAPEEITGTFDCGNFGYSSSDNKLINLKGCPKILKREDGSSCLDCGGIYTLRSLEGAPERIGFLYCKHTSIESFEGAPKDIYRVVASHCELKTLQGLVRVKTLDCSDNPNLKELGTTLEHCDMLSTDDFSFWKAFKDAKDKGLIS